MGPLVATHWLADRLGEPGLRVADVRWYLDPARQGRDAYRAGHIPGAVFLDAEADLSGPDGRRGGPLGRHPWPSAEQVARVMSAAGIGVGSRQIVHARQRVRVVAAELGLPELERFFTEYLGTVDGTSDAELPDLGAMTGRSITC